MGTLLLCLVGCFSMILWYLLFWVSYMHVSYFCICNCSAQLSMFHMERRSRNMLIIIIITINTKQYLWTRNFKRLQGISILKLLLPVQETHHTITLIRQGEVTVNYGPVSFPSIPRCLCAALIEHWHFSPTAPNPHTAYQLMPHAKVHSITVGRINDLPAQLTARLILQTAGIKYKHQHALTLASVTILRLTFDVRVCLIEHNNRKKKPCTQ